MQAAEKMQGKKKYTPKAETDNLSTALFLTGLSICLLLSANYCAGIKIWKLVVAHKSTILTDVVANLCFLGAAVLGGLVFDAKSLFSMFGYGLRFSSKEAGPVMASGNPLVDLYGLQSWDRTVSVLIVIINWLVAHGLIISSVMLGLSNPLAANSVSLSKDTVHDLVTGDVLLNPLIREWNWEALYGMGCGLHLGTYFAVAVAHKAQFNLRTLGVKGLIYGVYSIALLALAGFFRRRNYSSGWIGPCEGFWLVCCHVLGIWWAFDQKWHIQRSEAEMMSRFFGIETEAMVVPEFQNGICAFMNDWRGYKPITVFVVTSTLSAIFAYATPIYPFVLVACYWCAYKVHPFGRGWNKVLFWLTVAHQVVHYFVHSYRTLEDQPLLWVDKLVHFLYAVVAAQQFREQKEMLSRDPLVKAFNYINLYVWIPGDIIALYIAALHGPNDTYLKHMIGWGGYCLSTGTAMAIVNRDIESDNDPDSARRFIAGKSGLTGHGIQIFQALFFAVVYIYSTGGSAAWGKAIEYTYDYAAHLYTAYLML